MERAEEEADLCPCGAAAGACGGADQGLACEGATGKL